MRVYEASRSEPAKADANIPLVSTENPETGEPAVRDTRWSSRLLRQCGLIDAFNGYMHTGGSRISDQLDVRPSHGLRLWTGAAAGAVSAVAFAGIHYVLISNIWDMIGLWQ